MVWVVSFGGKAMGEREESKNRYSIERTIASVPCQCLYCGIIILDALILIFHLGDMFRIHV
jgi:hypothetical protein